MPAEQEQTSEVSSWIDALVARHTQSLSRPELLKAIRALSAWYVERRSELPGRSPTDSAGKRAAFAAFFAPLHLLTTLEIVRALGIPDRPVTRIMDLGCGTGASSAGWALACPDRPEIAGVDRQSWSLDEAAWNWRTLGLRGRRQRGDLVRAAADLARLSSGRRAAGRTAVLAAWSVNELDERARAALLPVLLALADQRHDVLVIEPLAGAATPWWPAWQRAWLDRGGRADAWKFHASLPAVLADLSEAAGFRRESLTAKTLWLAASPAAR